MPEPRCINCEVRLSRLRKHAVTQLEENIMNVIQLWTYPRDVTNTDLICHACWELARSQASNPDCQDRQFGHPQVCAPCGRSILRMNCHIIQKPNATRDERDMALIISRWIQPRQVCSTSQACGTCWYRARRELLHQHNESNVPEQLVTQDAEPIENPQVLSLGNENEQGNLPLQHTENLMQVCVNCDLDLHEQNSHELSENNANLFEIVKFWTHPKVITTTDKICQSCWELASHELNHSALEASPARMAIVQRRQQYIVLPSVRRAAETPRHCLFPNCNNNERYHIPDTIRRRVLCEYNFYIPRDARICAYHSGRAVYHELYTCSNSTDRFSDIQIEDMVFILASQSKNFDFNDIRSVPDNLVHYWLGITKDQHEQIINQTRLKEMHRGRFALTAILCKLRTGDSGDRLSTLFQTPRRTVENLMDKAREILVQDFVPQHLGMGHITRDEVAQKNSTIANGLFGNPESPIAERQAIVICDATYIFTQKSSNYLFQKDTYSLHKYRNLVKPFMIVCCDGYILDVLGPYSATTNDATIMSKILNDSDRLVEYFNEDDIFIVDRGFRDSIEIIENHGFQAHMPDTRSPGQVQLTTLEANRSRCVTICRWVVEAVNGHIKRDFKIFRHEYFNRASQHLMKDFTIAAALLNAYSTLFTNPTNAVEIVSIINERLWLSNILAEIVIEQSLNRRGGSFVAIATCDIYFPQLTMPQLILFACGTYQIRQARSYIGEQFRYHGIFSFEVCRDDQVDLSRFGGISTLLIKAKIKSRHVSRKTYYVYVVVDREQTGRQALLGYCCNCIVGLRTVGCCSHVMSIIWYLSYSRHQGDLTPPAQFLDSVIVRI